MSMRHIPSTAALVVALVAAAPAPADPLMFTSEFSIASLDLSGTGLMPLADDGAGGWMDMNTAVQVSLSGVAPSTVDVSIAVPLDLFSNPMAVLSGVVTGTFFLDLEFTDDDGTKDFGGGLTSPFTVSADSTKPLVVTVGLDATFLQLAAIQAHLDANPGDSIQDAVDTYNALTAGTDDDIVLTISDPGVKYALNADINNNGFDDAITYMGASLVLDTLYENVIIDGDLSDLGSDISVSATGLQFSGGIDDLVADPPFTIDLTGDILLEPLVLTPVPEPMTAGLLGLGLLAFAARRRKH